MNLRDIRWEAAGKLGAGLLLAIAIVASLPSLFATEKPKTLPPDVGVPQAAVVPAAPAPAPPPPRAPNHPRHERTTPSKRRSPEPTRRHRHKRGRMPLPGGVASSAAPIVASAPAPVIHAGARESFGFEQP